MKNDIIKNELKYKAILNRAINEEVVKNKDDEKALLIALLLLMSKNTQSSILDLYNIYNKNQKLDFTKEDIETANLMSNFLYIFYSKTIEDIIQTARETTTTKIEYLEKVSKDLKNYSKGFIVTSNTLSLSVLASSKIKTQYARYNNPMDARTSDFCRSIHGRIINLSAITDTATKILNIAKKNYSYDKAKKKLDKVNPFISTQQEDSFIEHEHETDKDKSFKAQARQTERLLNGMGKLPPFHYNCRTIIITV